MLSTREVPKLLLSFQVEVRCEYRNAFTFHVAINSYELLIQEDFLPSFVNSRILVQCFRIKCSKRVVSAAVGRKSVKFFRSYEL